MGTGHVVIYRFLCAPTGKTYVGKHECDPAGWPSEGCARLPDGYPGTGRWVKAARRKHGDSAFSWAILEVVPPGGDWQDAERRHVAAERTRVGKLCMNIRDGGEGHSIRTGREHMLRVWANPAFREKMRGVGQRMGRAQWEDPEKRERMRAALAKGQRNALSPSARARQSAAAREHWCDPVFRAERLAVLRANQREGSRRGADAWLLRAALRRRDAGEPPLFYDNRVLAEAGQAANPLPVPPPRDPLPRSKVGEALAALRRGPHTPDSLGAAIGLSPQDARYKIDALIRLYWPIENEGGVYRLVT